MRRPEGQSIVEMAFVMPVLVVILFGIIDLSYYIYGYATIYQAARDGAEAAAKTPPYPSQIGPLKTSDPCVANIVQDVVDGRVALPNFSSNNIRVTYPTTRALSEPIEVTISYDVQPLTPLWQFVAFGNDGRISMSATSRRSIESLGDNPNFENQIACSDTP